MYDELSSALVGLAQMSMLENKVTSGGDGVEGLVRLETAHFS